MREPITRSRWDARPSLEGLEGRLLLSTGTSGQTVPARVLAHKQGIAASDRELSYIPPGGGRVTITLYGVGSLAGSFIDPARALNLVFSGTNSQSEIYGHVQGGTHHAPIQSIRPAHLGVNSLSGIGGNAIARLHLKDFDLVDGGNINLTSGVLALFLNSVGHRTELHLRELPSTLTPATTSPITSNGLSLTYATDSTGAQTLSSVSGQFVAGPNLEVQGYKGSVKVPGTSTPTATAPSSTTGSGTTGGTTANILGTTPGTGTTSGTGTTTGKTANTVGGVAATPPGTGLIPGAPPAPPGILAVINHIRGTRTTSGLGNAQLFGYDAAQNALIRFDAGTGAAVQSISLAGVGTPVTGVGLGRANGTLVALIGNGTTIHAFNAVTGAAAGSFRTANLSSIGFNTIDGIGTSDGTTVVSDSSAGTLGMAVLLDVTASLNTGQAVTIGTPFSPQRQFELSGGLAGLPGSNTVYATGAAHFDVFQPNLTQFGLLALNTSGGALRETSRTSLTGKNGTTINTGPAGTARSAPFVGLGSVDQFLALVTGVSNGKNSVMLYTPQTGAPAGQITLNDPNLLSGLSESFRPDLVDAALIDVQGNIQSLKGTDATGLVLNDSGNLNLVEFHRASNTTIIGQPFGHAALPHRSNVTILSTARATNGRDGVTVDTSLKQIGPLSLPR